MTKAQDSSNQSGFSIAELLVVVAIMLILMTSVFGLMRDSTVISMVTYEMTDAQESLRTAQEYINRDLIVAGDRLRGLNNICVRTDFVVNFLTQNPGSTVCGGGTVNLPLVQSDDNVPANTQVLLTNPAVNVRANPALTDRINILQVDSSFTPLTVAASSITANGGSITIGGADIDRFNEGEIYFVASSTRATFGAITSKDAATGILTFSTGDPYGLNEDVNGGPISMVTDGGTLPVSIMRMRIIHYFINQNGLLIRRVFGVSGGVGHYDSVIAEHVTSLQFRYLLNFPGANVAAEQPVAQLLTGAQQIAVRQVEVSVTTETVHPMPSGSRQPITMTTTTS
ncbi:MAG TPA: prepilin-type N-terminal cleavage/methylation domain-containing protein, partial [Pyrinomonadaceae bacterium]